MTSAQQERIQAMTDVETFVSAVSTVNKPSKLSSSTTSKGASTVASIVNSICDPDLAEQSLRSTINAVVADFAKQAAETVAEMKRRLESEFTAVGLECFIDYDTQHRLRELFPSKKRLDSIAELMKEAASKTVRRRVSARFDDLEASLKTIHRGVVSDPLGSAVRTFVDDLLHYVSVTVGNRTEFLRERFNLRLKSLIRAAHAGQLDTWSALSDEEDDEVAIFRRNAAHQSTSNVFSPLPSPTASGTVGNLLLSSSSSSALAALGGGTAAASSAATAAFVNAASSSVVTKTRIANVPQRVAKIEGASTAVLTELTELRSRLDRMTQTRHNDIEAIKKQYEQELDEMRQSASNREHVLRTEAADLRVRVSDLDRIVKQTGGLIRRLDLQCARYTREISLLVELSRHDKHNVYAVLAKRLTELERVSGALQRDEDDEVLQRVGVSLGAPCQTAGVLTKQHELLEGMTRSLMNHKQALAWQQENERLEHENAALRAELIHIRNAARHFETDCRNTASVREQQLLKELHHMRELLNKTTEKLQTASIAVIGTDDQLTADLVKKLEETEARYKALETEFNIHLTLGASSRNSSRNSVRPQSATANANATANAVGSSSREEQQKPQETEQESQQEAEQKQQQESAKSATTTVIPARYLEPDIRAKIVARPPSAYTARNARPPLQPHMQNRVEYQEEQKQHIPLAAPPKHARGAGYYWEETSNRDIGVAAVPVDERKETAASSLAARPASAASAASGVGAKYKRDRERQLRAATSAIERQVLLASHGKSRNWNRVQ